jgi:CHAT domain-containing protein
MRVVVEVVRQLGCQRAVLVAGGFLSVMPLHAASYLPLAGEPASAPGARRYACDDIDFTYTPSGLTLLAARATAQRQARQRPAQRALVVGNPQLTLRGERWAPGSDSYLRFAEWEAQRVAELAGQRVPTLQVDLQTNDAATWIAVRDGLRASDLAHLSLHARFDVDNPDRSALLVAFRSHLYLRDLLQVNLARLRLIVLSACQSGQSDVQRQSEEAVGLFGALLAAGAPAVVGTLWSVNDLATARFMESFARRAYGADVAPDAALRAAARELRGVGDAVATSAETGARPPELASAAEAPMAQPAATPARVAIARDMAQEPALAGVARQMSVENWAMTSAQAAGMRGLLQRGPEHPMYWAAFVYYGAEVSLAGVGAQDALPMEAASRGESNMASDDQRDDDQSNQPNADGISQPETSEALPIAVQRTEGYFSEAGEVCPRCSAEDYLPVRDASGRNLRQCASCGLLYTLDGGAEVDQ